MGRKDRDMLVNGLNETSQAHSQILHPGSRALFSYWEKIRAEAAAPPRSALDLKQLRDLIPNLMIIEHEPRSGGFTWRLAGALINDFYRRDVKGNSVVKGWESFEANIARSLLNGVIQKLQPCLLRLRLRTDLEQIIGAEMIGLPLRSSDGKSIQVFGGLFAFRDTLSLRHRHITAIELSGARSIWTEHLPGDPLARQLGKADRPPFQPFQIITGGRPS